jgi:recombination protein RecA
MDRARVTVEEPEVVNGGRYFRSPALEFFSTGCTLLDNMLGGGWPLGRVSNVVGDKSTGKTLLAIEASNSFAKTFPSGRIRYAESEAAFDSDYAASLGMPTERVSFTEADEVEFLTVEDFFRDLTKFADDLGEGEPGLYILDTLDALSDSSELAERVEDFSKGTYGTQKAKQMGKLFRMCVRQIKNKRCHLMIISQERDNIGVMFGKKSTRSGGRALDFYASQVLWLAKRGELKQTIQKIERTVGVEIRAKTEKNKIAMPFKTVDFLVRFNFGIDDLVTSLDWLEQVGKESLVLGDQKRPSFIKDLSSKSDEEYWKVVSEIGVTTSEVWKEIEDRFRPQRSRV